MEGCIKGIDVSHYQGEIDWKAVKAAGVEFAIIKATEGDTYEDPRLDENAIGADRVGIAAYLYHFFRPEINVDDQVSNFLFAWSRLPSKVFAWLDVEVQPRGAGYRNSAQVTVFALDWIQQFEKRTYSAARRKVGLYTYPDFAAHHLDSGLEEYPLWISHFGVSVPTVPKQLGKGAEDWDVWQYTNQGVIPGIKGKVDMNWMKKEFFNGR